MIDQPQEEQSKDRQIELLEKALEKLNAENEEKQKLLDEVFARVDRYQTTVVPELQQENEQLKQLQKRLQETMKKETDRLEFDKKEHDDIDKQFFKCSLCTHRRGFIDKLEKILKGNEKID